MNTKLAIFSPRPDSINPINPSGQKRIPKGPYDFASAIGASRMDFEGAGMVDKRASFTKKAQAILDKL
jgi:hypothetical protein